jgi:hypothetical protein
MTRIDNVAFPAQWGKPALAPARCRPLVSVPLSTMPEIPAEEGPIKLLDECIRLLSSGRPKKA